MTHRLASNRVPAVIVALLVSLLASALHYAFSTPFSPVRIPVLDAEQTASRRVVSVALPDLSDIRGQTAVMDLELRNGPEARRVGLLRDGLPAYRVELPPSRDTQWTIVLSPDLLEALYRQAGDAARTLELTADGDVWSLTAFEIRNYHVRWGDRFGVALLPAASVGRFPRVVLSTPAFLLLMLAVSTPMALYLFRGSRASAIAPKSMFARAARFWRAHRMTLERGAALLGLAAIAIAQPIFEVVANSPEFFAARSTPPATIVATVLAICFGLPLLLLAVERTIRIVSPRGAAAVQGFFVAILGAAVVMPWLGRSGAVAFPWNVVIAALGGIAAGITYARGPFARQFLTALAPAALVVPALFLLSLNVERPSGPESAVAVQTVQRTPPIVLVIFDEFPTNSLLAGDGSIDARRYPNFGALARSAYWFRNASTVAYNTSDAVPALLSGRYVPSAKAVPSLRHYPVNLFSALARHYRIFASIRFQSLCPPRACERNAAIRSDSVRLLLSDLGLVWLHIVLPEHVAERLPPVVGEWAEFGGTAGTPMRGIRRGREGWFAEFLSAIDDQPARMHVIHLVLPHMPLEYVPSGRRYSAPDFQQTRVDGRLLFEKASPALADTIHQRHLAQVGYADRLVGELIAHLRRAGAYDDALVIITSDHGASHREGRRRREPRPSQENLSDILQVPLFIKLPNQQQGETIDRIVETVDILPTILDVVGARTSFHLDGRSLIDGRDPGRTSFFLRSLGARARPLGDLSADRASSLERKERRFGRGDLQGLYAPPGGRHLLGMDVKQIGFEPAADVHVTLDNLPQYESVALDRDPLPLYVSGVLETPRPDPLSVVVVVNGRVAALAQSYRARGGHMFGTLIPETALRDGHNEVVAFVVVGF